MQKINTIFFLLHIFFGPMVIYCMEESTNAKIFDIFSYAITNYKKINNRSGIKKLNMEDVERLEALAKKAYQNAASFSRKKYWQYGTLMVLTGSMGFLNLYNFTHGENHSIVPSICTICLSCIMSFKTGFYSARLDDDYANDCKKVNKKN